MSESRFNFYSVEQSILKEWNENNINQLISQQGEDDFVFFDGPPFVSGDLHNGHKSVAFIKDIVLRFQRMTGKKCIFKLGFDCHGLPSENMMMKKLGLSSKKDIDKFGVDRFISESIKEINNLSNSWKPSYDLVARIADFNNQYKTIDTKFMESVWWIFKQMYTKGLVYKAYKVMPYSYYYETPLSNFEAGSNYKDIQTNSIYVKLQLKNDPNTFIVVWTTTSWSLLSNVAVVVNPNLQYVLCHCENGDKLIVAQNAVNNLKMKFTKTELYKKGFEMKGMEYIPPYNFMKFTYHKILVDNYVTDVDPKKKDSSGTGCVHVACAHGDDDCRICIENKVIESKNLDQTCLVDDQGKFVKGTGQFEGMLVFDASKAIVKGLKTRNLIVREQNITHSYPHCERSDTPLIYKITSSYFVEVTKVKDQMIELANKTTWSNSETKNRFLKWLEDARDWCVSRNRIFGTPLPVWESEDETESVIIGSIDELKQLSKLDDLPDNFDLHYPSLKNITITSSTSGKVLKLCGMMFDCWWESGAMPYAQHHYPFENTNMFDNREFLCDFITEGLDQTRGWFYTLLVISTIISGKAPFKNVICTGLIMGKDGKKESKRNGNFVPPKERIEKYGADSLRLYVASSKLISGEPIKFMDETVQEMGDKLLHYLNSLRFYLEQKTLIESNNLEVNVTYLAENNKENITNPMDLWIIRKLSDLTEYVKYQMNLFQLDKATTQIIEFIEDICNWYVKLNRNRLKGKDGIEEQQTSLSTLFTVLYDFTLLLAPFAPFTTEYVYQKLAEDFINDPRLSFKKSIHMCQYPNIKREWVDVETFEGIKNIVLAVREIRHNSKKHQAQRVPIKKCIVYHYQLQFLENARNLISLVEDEINSLEFDYQIISPDMISLKVTINDRSFGQKFRGDAKTLRPKIETLSQEDLIKLKKENQIIIEGKTITTDEVDIKTVINMATTDNLSVHSTDQLTLVTDMTFDQEVNEKNNLKMFVATVQRTRKNMGLKPWNKIKVYLHTTNESVNFISKYMSDISQRLGCEIELSNETLEQTQEKYSYIDLEGNKYYIDIYVNVL